MSSAPYAWLLALGAMGSSLREGPPPVLDPQKYSSPSGAFVLEVNPTARLGQGPGRYTLTRDGAEVWSAELPFTFWEAVVTDEGVAAGHAYTNGYRDRRPPEGEFVVAAIDPQGVVLFRDATKRQAPSHPEGPAIPVARGLFLDARGRLVVRVDERGPMHIESMHAESWWCYRLAADCEKSQRAPAGALPWFEKWIRIQAAAAVPTTPLTMVHGSSLKGAAFALVDPDWKAVWNLELPSDYAEPSDGRRKDELWAWQRRGNAIAVGSAPARFEVVTIADESRITFEAVSEAGSGAGWFVRELGRVPHRVSLEEPPAAEIPAVELKKLGEVVLGEAPASSASAVSDVAAFSIVAGGLLEIVRSSATSKAEFSWCLADRKGIALREVSFTIPVDPDSARIVWHPIAESRWLATASGYGVGGVARAWWADLESGSLQEITEFDCPAIEHLAPAPAGGFVVLGKVTGEFSIAAALLAFDSSGKLRWKHEEPGYVVSKEPSSLFAASDIAVLANGTVAVVSSIRDTLQLFDADGRFLRLIDLAKAWATEADYPGGVWALPGDQVLVHDSGGNHAVLWRTPLDGSASSRIEPSHADGHQPAPSGYAITVAPDGALWTTDRQVLFRLDERGVVAEVIGEPAIAGPAKRFDETCVDSLGRILALDHEARVVQVFAPDGRKQLDARLDIEDVPVRRKPMDATDGGVLVKVQSGEYVRFDATGKRVGRERLTSDPGPHSCVFRPGTSERWILGGFVPTELVYYGASTERPADAPVIARRPDGRWLRSPGSCRISGDGTLTVVDGSDWSERGKVGAAICVYAADGRPLQQIDLPYPGQGRDLAVLADWFALGSSKAVVLVERRGGRRLRFEPDLPKGPNAHFQTYASRDGRELWLVEHSTRTLTRYALP